MKWQQNLESLTQDLSLSEVCRVVARTIGLDHSNTDSKDSKNSRPGPQQYSSECCKASAIQRILQYCTHFRLVAREIT